MVEQFHRMSKHALASVALGAVSFLYLVFEELFLAVPAVICGHVALAGINRSGQGLRGKRLAIIGLALGYSVIAITAFALGLVCTGLSAGN
jgi:hypothetical protein